MTGDAHDKHREGMLARLLAESGFYNHKTENDYFLIPEEWYPLLGIERRTFILDGISDQRIADIRRELEKRQPSELS